MLLLNLMLAFAWISLTGEFTAVNFFIGFGLSFILIWLAQRTMGSSNYFRKVQQVGGLVSFFGWELLLANLRSAYFVLNPKKLSPGVVAIPLSIKHETAITLLVNLITLTPGSLSLDISDDRSTLYVHSMHIADADKFRQAIKDGFERRIKELFS